MATIDNLDQSVYNMYAYRTRLVEQINQQYQLKDASSIPPQTQVIDILPKPSELDLLLGVVAVSTPWAFFFPPKKYHRVRRSPFSYSGIASSIGDSEENEELIEQLEGMELKSAEQIRQKTVLTNCLKQMNIINDWIGHIVGRIGQFLQG